MSRRDEILAKVRRRIVVCPDTGCHIWQGPTSGNGRGGGYPRMYLDGQTVAVHRVVYVTIHGYIPGKMQIDHRCRNRMCVNPRCLEMGTHQENQRRRAAAVVEKELQHEEG